MNYYDEFVKIITSKEKFVINLGLERISKFMKLYDNPQNKINVIHLAGTNGKGSTASIIAKILQSAGYKTGLYTSPHIEKYNERIKINGIDIEDEKLFELLTKVLESCKTNDINLSEFEILTAIAFLYYEHQKVDFLVLETGLGGRLDATNIVKKPLLSIITSISLDHTERLGDTIEKIATEKAGIIKPDRPLVISQSNKGYETVLAIANKHNAPVITTKSKISIIPNLENNFAQIDGKKIKFSLLGKHQAQNLALSIEAIKELRKQGVEISTRSVEKALEDVRHGSRFEYKKDLNLLIDGAHNSDGAKALKNSLDKYFPNTKKCFIYASINTKDFKIFLKTVLEKNDKLFLYNFERQNAVPTKEIQKLFPNSENISAKQVLDLVNTNNKNKILTIITGSLYAIGDLNALIFTKNKYSPGG